MKNSHCLRAACLFGLLLIAVSAASGEEFSLGHTMTREAPHLRSAEPTGVVKKFSDLYKKNRSPKLAIFLNRTLSDDVAEWKTSRRAVVAGSGSVTSSTETVLHYREETVKGPVAVYEQQRNGVEDARDNAAEPYLWELESGFMQPFLHAGANLVDRATILRLVSKNHSQGDGAGVIDTKKNEMDALVNYADIYIELLVTRAPSAPTGYEFKAVAKEIKTGRVLGIATSLNWDWRDEQPKKIVTDPRQGYKIVNDTRMPKVQHVSRDIALDLMKSMASGWSLN